MAAASSAFAVAGYRRAAFSSQTTSSASATVMPMTTRTGGCSQPCSTEYFRKYTAANTSAMPAIAGEQLDADEALPVERRRRRLGWNRRRRRPRRPRRRSVRGRGRRGRGRRSRANSRGCRHRSGRGRRDRWPGRNELPRPAAAQQAARRARSGAADGAGANGFSTAGRGGGGADGRRGRGRGRRRDDGRDSGRRNDGRASGPRRRHRTLRHLTAKLRQLRFERRRSSFPAHRAPWRAPRPAVAYAGRTPTTRSAARTGSPRRAARGKGNPSTLQEGAWGAPHLNSPPRHSNAHGTRAGPSPLIISIPRAPVVTVQ